MYTDECTRSTALPLKYWIIPILSLLAGTVVIGPAPLRATWQENQRLFYGWFSDQAFQSQTEILSKYRDREIILETLTAVWVLLFVSNTSYSGEGKYLTCICIYSGCLTFQELILFSCVEAH